MQSQISSSALAAAIKPIRSPIFGGFELPLALHEALADMKFTEPTPIQAQAVPVALLGHDLIACAQTGTGKTAAFGIPTIAKLLADPEADALVLAPTRELAQQVATVFQDLLAHAPKIGGALLTGGSSMVPQLRALSRRPRVIVATPGRLIDHLERGSARLDRVRVLILDEADRMLDMGFAPQLERVLKALPKERQTLLFSATIPPDIQRLSAKFMRTPERISVSASVVPQGTIEQRTLKVRSEDKNDALLDQINARTGSILVFVGTQRRADRIAKYLDSYGVKVDSIHGGRSQGQRNRALQGLRDGRIRVLVATDVAARGLDVPSVAHVINYDLPMVPEDYVHRIGRTGRAGRSGEAVSFVSSDDRPLWLAIRRLLHKASAAEKASRPLHDEIEADVPGQNMGGGRGPSRGGPSRSGSGLSLGPRSGGGGPKRRPQRSSGPGGGGGGGKRSGFSRGRP